MWEFSKIRGHNIDPKSLGSDYKGTHKKDTQFIETAIYELQSISQG